MTRKIRIILALVNKYNEEFKERIQSTTQDTKIRIANLEDNANHQLVKNSAQLTKLESEFEVFKKEMTINSKNQVHLQELINSLNLNLEDAKSRSSEGGKDTTNNITQLNKQLVKTQNSYQKLLNEFEKIKDSVKNQPLLQDCLKDITAIRKNISELNTQDQELDLQQEYKLLVQSNEKCFALFDKRFDKQAFVTKLQEFDEEFYCISSWHIKLHSPRNFRIACSNIK